VFLGFDAGEDTPGLAATVRGIFFIALPESLPFSKIRFSSEGWSFKAAAFGISPEELE
jgi:hypothetical protein